MNKEKLFKQIETMKKIQAKKYELCMQKLINKYPEHYKNKKKK